MLCFRPSVFIVFLCEPAGSSIVAWFVIGPVASRLPSG